MKPNKHQLAAVLVAVLLLASGATAYSAIFTAGGGTSYEAGSGLVVETTTDHGLDGTNPFTDSETIYIDGVSISSSGTADLTADQFRGEWTNVSSVDASTSEISIDPDDKPASDIDGDVTALSFRETTLDDDQVAFEHSSNGPGTVSVHGFDADREWTAATTDGEVVDTGTTDGSGVAGVNVDSASNEQVILFENDAPEIDNSSASPTGGGVVDSVPTLSINVSDKQFATEQGENLTVEWFVDGEKRGETAVGGNGTASYELGSIDGGEHTWHAVVTDSYGGETTSQTFNFSAPAELRVFSESNPDQLIDDNVSLRVRFFASGNEDVVEREVTDGTVDLAGLPADQRYIVTVRANDSDQWTYRRIVVDSLIETSDIYLLNESEDHSQIIFELDDPTGQFPPEETTLYVEKPITKDYDDDGETETRYQVIAGDTFGASGDFPAILQNDARYRLRVETSDGESSRILGYYSASGSTVEQLQIERVEPGGDSDQGVSFRATIEGDEGDQQIAIRYNDFSESTEYVEYEVVDENGTVVVPNTTREVNEFADIYPVPAEYGDDPAFEVNYHVVREDRSQAGTIGIGRLSGIGDRFGLDPQILSLLSWAAILGSMGLVVISNQRIAPLTGTAVASGLTIVGTIAIPMTVLSIAGAVSVLVAAGGAR